MAVGDYSWNRQVIAQNSVPANRGVHLIGGAAANERVERVILDFHIAAQSSTSADLLVWVQQGIVVLIEWTTASGGAPPTPTAPTQADLSGRDVLASAYSRMGPVETFTDVHMVPAYGDAVRLDARVTRRPTTGGNGSVWCTWALGAIGGTPPAIGFEHLFSRVLTQQVAP